MSQIIETLKAMSMDSAISDDTVVVADALARLYSNDIAALIEAANTLMADDDWSSDREPYLWLADVVSNIE